MSKMNLDNAINSDLTKEMLLLMKSMLIPDLHKRIPARIVYKRML
jgi:hypothetical protein